MDFKRTISAGVMAAGLGVAGLAGFGMGAAAADPGQPCGGPNQQNCQQGPGQGQGNRGQGQNNQSQDDHGRAQNNNGQGQDNNRGPGQDPQHGPDDFRNRNIDEGRQDHQPFNYFGQQVNPVWDNGHNGWGFWFLNNWIPL